jgi:hypothetical protein
MPRLLKPSEVARILKLPKGSRKIDLFIDFYGVILCFYEETPKRE